MAFQLSPGVNVTEIDLTTVVPAVATSDGAFAGLFRWGPVGERFLVDSETLLVSKFGKPSNYNAETFFTAANFLSYSNRLYIARAANISGPTPAIGVVSSRKLANLSYTGTASGYSNSDTVTVVSEHGVNATATVTTNATGGSLTFQITAVGTGINSSPTVQITTSGGTGATVVANVVATNTAYVVSGNAASVNTSMYVTQTTDANAIATGKNVTVTGRSGNFVTFNHTIDTTSDTIYLGELATSYTAVGFDPAAAGGVVANLVNQIVPNINAYTALDGNFDPDVAFVAKYPGAIGNSLRVSVCDSADSFSSNVGYATSTNTAYITTLDFTIGSNTAVAVFADKANTAANVSQYSIGDNILAGNGTIGYQYLQITELAVSTNTSANTATLTMNFQDPYRLHTNFSTNNVVRYWEFHNKVDSAPGTSEFVATYGNNMAIDELHTVVVDDAGQFTGVPGTILEIYKGLSRATDAKNNDTTTNYYKDVINQNSQYIWFANDRSGAPSANAALVTSSTNESPSDIMMVLGSDGLDESSEHNFPIIAAGYDMFRSAEDVDISLVLQGRPIGGAGASYQLANYIIDNIVEIRKDCIALISPDKTTTLNAFGAEALNLVDWRNSVHSSSYAVLDSGYKYQYDRYNDIYRWIPLNGDIAGLCARTDNTNDAWWSPAGFNRGQIKNLVKLAYNPRQADRDILYKNGINPVVTFPGQGTILYGDKTLQAKPSAFDRINVRRLFIVLEKAISIAAKYSLFEFNDSFTRSQFKNLVTPYLRTIQGRRGITDFLVVCDDTNNTPQIIDTNQFVGDIYIKPARSINFIQLNFVAVGTGVQFSEVVGKF